MVGWGQPNNDINKLKYKDFILEEEKYTVIYTDSDNLNNYGYGIQLNRFNRLYESIQHH